MPTSVRSRIHEATRAIQSRLLSYQDFRLPPGDWRVGADGPGRDYSLKEVVGTTFLRILARGGTPLEAHGEASGYVQAAQEEVDDLYAHLLRLLESE